MPINQIAWPRYKLTKHGTPSPQNLAYNNVFNDFRNVTYSDIDSSGSDMPTAVAFTSSRGALLQSPQEALMFRVADPQNPNMPMSYLTRAVAIYHKVDRDWYIAIDDIPDAVGNIAISGAQEGHDSHSKNNCWLLDHNDKKVSSALQRASQYSTRRIIKIDPKDKKGGFSLTIPAGESKCDYLNNHKSVKAIFGDCSDLYAQYIGNSPYSLAVKHLSFNDLEKLKAYNQVEIRALAFGRTNSQSVEYIVLNMSFSNNSAYARGTIDSRVWK